jgi:RTX calcium-binding nonapeptide repeat (4 copies)
VIRQRRLIAVVVFLIGCAFLLLVGGCAGVGSEAPQKQQGHTKATKQKQEGHTEATEAQARSPEVTTSEVLRCEGTRSFHRKGYLGPYVTNDMSGCPTGGLLSGTDKPDNLAGKKGDDEILGLGDQDALHGGPGNDLMVGGTKHGEGHYKSNDVLYGGPGADFLYVYSQQTNGCCGKDVMYGGDGNDTLFADDGDAQRDELYCGEGFDRYMADKTDLVSRSCEKKWNGVVY